MQRKIQEILKSTQFIADKNLAGLVWLKLQRRIQLINRVKFVSYLSLSLVSVISLYVFATKLYSELNQSGFYNYTHLIFSEDISTLISFWKEILYSVFESLPATSLMLSLGLLFVFVLSLKNVLSLRWSFN